MDIQATKLDILQSILNLDKESLLIKIKNLIEEEMIVGYTTAGEPLTKKQYNKQLKEAEEQIIEGNFLSQKELEEQVKNWK